MNKMSLDEVPLSSIYDKIAPNAKSKASVSIYNGLKKSG